MVKDKNQDGRKSTATIRKPCKRGELTQKMMAFRLDSDLADLLTGVLNKGRLINDLLREHFKKLS